MNLRLGVGIETLAPVLFVALGGAVVFALETSRDCSSSSINSS